MKSIYTKQIWLLFYQMVLVKLHIQSGTYETPPNIERDLPLNDTEIEGISVNGYFVQQILAS